MMKRIIVLLIRLLLAKLGESQPGTWYETRMRYGNTVEVLNGTSDQRLAFMNFDTARRSAYLRGASDVYTLVIRRMTW